MAANDSENDFIYMRWQRKEYRCIPSRLTVSYHPIGDWHKNDLMIIQEKIWKNSHDSGNELFLWNIINGSLLNRNCLKTCTLLVEDDTGNQNYQQKSNRGAQIF